jgi:hypothetical protein
MRMQMKKQRLQSDASRFSFFGIHSNRFGPRICLKRQFFVPRCGERLRTTAESLVEVSRLRLDSRLKQLRRGLVGRHYGAEDLIFRVHFP